MSNVGFYITFSSQPIGELGDRLGGPPTHRPSAFPWPVEDDQTYALLAEFVIDGLRLNIPDFDWLQLYQGIDDGDDPTPVAMLVRKRDEQTSRTLPLHPIGVRSIQYSVKEDPEEVSFGPDSETYFFFSKLGGVDPWAVLPGARFLGQLDEAGSDLNFGGFTCVIYLRDDNSVEVFLR